VALDAPHDCYRFARAALARYVLPLVLMPVRPQNIAWQGFPWLIIAAIALQQPVHAGIMRKGRDLGGAADAKFSVTFGSARNMEVLVEETTRRFYDVTDQQFKQDDAERFDLNDFNIDEDQATIGLFAEKVWTWWSFQFDLSVANPEIDTVARRNYYITVGEDLHFEDVRTDQMKIPEGTPFTVDLIAIVSELRFLFHPFTLQFSESFRFTPWIDLGLYIVGGYYELDAGPSTGVVQYQFPPEDFIVGGEATGFLGALIPDAGVGGEFRFGVPEGRNLVVQGHYVITQYDGSTRFFTSADHREKDLDLDHSNMRIRAFIEFPRGPGKKWFIGIQHQAVETEAEITVQDRPVEELIERRERFDKHFEYRVEYTTGIVGLTF
jgi:hypothetical protein